MTGLALSKPTKARWSPRKTPKNRRVASKAVRAVVSRDYDAQNPFKMWNQFGTLVICDTDRYSVAEAIGPQDLGGFCNANFDVDRMLEEVWIDNEFSVGEYVKRYGALVAYVNGGFVVAGHDQIVKEFGHDDARSRGKAWALIDSEAQEYMGWLLGETYKYELYDDHKEDGSYDEVIVDHSKRRNHDRYGEFVGGVGGYYGYEDYAETAAMDALAHYVRDIYGREPNLAGLSGRSVGSKSRASASKASPSKRGSARSTRGVRR